MKLGSFSGLFSTMMPGENQSGAGAGGIACEATAGTCPNCSVLNQSLDEYVAALLTLKQKIIDTDQLLSEYKEKCDELQKSQRESSKLHKELDEVLLRLGPLEKQTADYEALKAELEETKAALKEFQQKSEQVDVLREEKAEALALKVKLEDDLKKAGDAANAQKVENVKLRSEKKLLEDDLRKTQESLRMSQQVAEEVDHLKLQNAKTLILKSNLENQLLALEDAKLKQLDEIRDWRSKTCRLEESLRISQEKLTKLEKEFHKEKRCSSTQTDTEPKVDKAKVRLLLEELWHCVEPLSQTPEKFSSKEPTDNQNVRIRISGPSVHPLAFSPLRSRTPRSLSTPNKGTKASPQKRRAEPSLDQTSPSTDQRNREPGRKKNQSLGSEEPDQSSTRAGERSVHEDDQVEMVSSGESLTEILDHFRPLPAALSPVPVSNQQAVHKIEPSLPSLKKSISNDNVGQTPAPPTEPKPVEEAVVAPSVRLDSEAPSLSVHTHNKALNVSSESHEMEVDALCVMKHDSACTATTIKVPNGVERERVSVNPARTPAMESEPSPVEDDDKHTNMSRSDLGGEIRESKALCNQKSTEGLVCELRNSENNCLGADDKSVEGNVSENCSVSAKDVKDSLTITSTNGVQNREDGQDRDLPRTKINGVASVGSSSGESSDEEEFFGLKRKVRGISSRENLDSATANQPESNGNLDQGETKDDGCLEPEKEDEAGLKESLIMDEADPEDGVVVDDQETALAKDEELKSAPQNAQKSGSPTPENMDAGLEEGDAKPDPGLNAPETALVKAVNLPLAFGDTLPSTPRSESIRKVRTEMGPPLPPLVLPLTATPPKYIKHQTLNRPTSLPEGSCSLKQQRLKAPSPDSARPEEETISPCLTTPSPTCGVPSSPLQFGSATPKHAVPVPGRLPSSALSASSPSGSQENSMQMLDTMYPELSAQARTLNILKGNLGRSINENGSSPPSVNPISGNKTINSSSTAFTKTEQKAKRTGANVLLPKSAKRLRLDTCSPDPAVCHMTPPPRVTQDHLRNGVELNPANCQSRENPDLKREAGVKRDEKQTQIMEALEKLGKSLFDVLPVIRSHVFLKRISEVPVLRDEEKSVISDFCSNQSSADEFMAAILNKMKAERTVLKQELLQSLCRVYVGLCRQKGDYQRAHALAFSILKEDFPDAPKLILFVVTTWPNLLSQGSCLCRAIHSVSKLKAEGEILDYLSMYLHWDQKPPGDIHTLISSMLKELLEDVSLNFQKHERHGDDLCPAAWEYIFSLDLLCAHVGWKWTHDHVIGKQLWPVMDAWVTQPRHTQTPIRDACVAAVLRLIGRLGQLGLKEKLCSSVQNIAKAINIFGKHGITEGVPIEVQLSAVYAIYDLAPSNPKDALEALASWRGETAQPVPSAVTSCITQIGSLCRQIKP